ncbi:MAG: alpha/beta fold hydrolase [Chloroflexi bacterium]|nr:alpha/beta fold hydrolase [Chloroflexota bacterium]
MTNNQVHKTTVAGIPALWVEPASTTARQLVIWLPGFSGHKEALQDNLQELAQAGFVGLSFDPLQHGERRIETNDQLRQRVRGNIRRYFWPILAQTAEETPVIIDWAIQTLGVAPQVGIGGISMGGDISIAAAGVDPRIVAVAACVATPDWLRPGSFEPPGAPDEFAQACYDRRNPLTHLELYTHCPAITFQCGAEDQQVPPDGAQRFVAALQTTYAQRPDALTIELQPATAHKFTPEMWQNSLRWFAEQTPP